MPHSRMTYLILLSRHFFPSPFFLSSPCWRPWSPPRVLGVLVFSLRTISIAYDITDSRREPCKMEDAIFLFELALTLPLYWTRLQSPECISSFYRNTLNATTEQASWISAAGISITSLRTICLPSAMIFFSLNKKDRYKWIHPGQCTGIFTRADTAPTQGRQGKQRPGPVICTVYFLWSEWRLYRDMECCTFFVSSAQLIGNIRLTSAEQMTKSISWDPSGSPTEKPGLSWYHTIHSCQAEWWLLSAPIQDAHARNLWICYLSWQKKNMVQMWLRVLIWEGYPEFSNWAQCNHKWISG